MGKYEVKVKPGVTIKTQVLDNVDVIDSRLSQFIPSIAGSVVGLNFKSSPGLSLSADLLVLISGSQCLIIKLRCINHPSDMIKNFFNDEKICFVFLGRSEEFSNLLMNWKNINTNKNNRCFIAPSVGVELGNLAAKVLKKPSLTECFLLKELAEPIGVNYKAPKLKATDSKATTCLDWSADVLSDEDVKDAIHEAYMCFDIGKTLLGML